MSGSNLTVERANVRQRSGDCVRTRLHAAVSRRLRLTFELYECPCERVLTLFEVRVATRRGRLETVGGGSERVEDCSACRRQHRLGQRGVQNALRLERRICTRETGADRGPSRECSRGGGAIFEKRQPLYYSIQLKLI